MSDSELSRCKSALHDAVSDLGRHKKVVASLNARLCRRGDRELRNRAMLLEKKQHVAALTARTKELLHTVQDEASERRTARHEAARLRQRAQEQRWSAQEARELYDHGNVRRHRADQRSAKLAQQVHDSATALKRLHAAHAIERARREEAEAALARCQAALKTTAAQRDSARAQKKQVLAGIAAFVVSCSCATANSLSAQAQGTGAGRRAVSMQQPGSEPRNTEAVLDLSRCGLGDEGAFVLAEAFRRALAPAVRGSAADAGSGDSCIHALPLSIRLSENAIGDTGAAALSATLGSCPSLLSLDLRGNEVGAPGLRALLAGLVEQRGAALRRGRALATAAACAAGAGPDDHIVDPVAPEAVAREVLPTLRHLDLSDNPIPHVARSLAHWRGTVGAVVGAAVVASLGGVREPAAGERAAQAALAKEGGAVAADQQLPQQQSGGRWAEECCRARWRPIAVEALRQPRRRSRSRSAPPVVQLVDVGDAPSRGAVATSASTPAAMPAAVDWRPPVQLALPLDDGGAWAAPSSRRCGGGGFGAVVDAGGDEDRIAELTTQVCVAQNRLQHVHGEAALAATVKAAKAHEADLGFGGGSRDGKLGVLLLGCGDRDRLVGEAHCEPSGPAQQLRLLSSPGRIRPRK